jgi:outer membrane protein TolC
MRDKTTSKPIEITIMKPNQLSAVGLLAFLAGGCAHLPSVGPDYHAPETQAPAHWGETLAGGETNAAAASTDWWKNFHDAELDSLIERAARSNLDLRIAQGRVREARAANGGCFRFLRAPAAKPEPTAAGVPPAPGGHPV